MTSDNGSQLAADMVDVTESADDIVVDIDDFVFLVLMTYVAPTLFAVITVVGVTGNALVIYVIASSPRMRSSVTTVLLLNLAVADLLFLFICVPFTAYKFYSTEWWFGNLACQLVQFALYVSVYVTIYTLVAISALRYVMVVHASNSRLSYRANPCKIVGFIVTLWICFVGVNVPTLLAHTTKQLDHYTYCGISDESIAPLFFTFFAFGYAVPLSAISGLYLLIVRFLRTRKPTSIDQQRARERTSRACRVISLVVVVFGVAWLPHHVNAIVSYYYGLPGGHIYTMLRVVWYCMSYGNSCVNPFIYNYASAEFRTGFRHALGRCCCCCYCAGSSSSSSSAATAGPSAANGDRCTSHRRRRLSPPTFLALSSRNNQRQRPIGVDGGASPSTMHQTVRMSPMPGVSAVSAVQNNIG